MCYIVKGLRERTIYKAVCEKEQENLQTFGVHRTPRHSSGILNMGVEGL